jgi:hypothetical protein
MKGSKTGWLEKRRRLSRTFDFRTGTLNATGNRTAFGRRVIETLIACPGDPANQLSCADQLYGVTG